MIGLGLSVAARPRSGVGGGVVYDPDALDYFTRAEAMDADAFSLGGEFTPEFRKSQINNRVVVLKASGAWDQLDEIWPLSGVSYTALPAKLKHSGTPIITLTNSTAANYTAVGALPGWKGNITDREIDTSWSPDDTVTYPNANHGSFFTEAPSAGDFRFQGAYTGNGSLLAAYVPANDGTIRSEMFATPTNQLIVASAVEGCILFSADATSHLILKDGVEIATGAAPAGGSVPTATYKIGSGGGFYYSDARQAIAWGGKNLTAPQEAAINAFASGWASDLGYV